MTIRGVGFKDIENNNIGLATRKTPLNKDFGTIKNL